MMRLQTWSLTLMDRWIVRISLMIRILVAFCDSSNLQKKKAASHSAPDFPHRKVKELRDVQRKIEVECLGSMLPLTSPINPSNRTLCWCRSSRALMEEMKLKKSGSYVLSRHGANCKQYTLLTIYLNGGMIEHEGYCIYCPASPILWYDITCKEVRVMYVYIAPMYMYIGSLMGYWGNHYLYIRIHKM